MSKKALLFRASGVPLQGLALRRSRKTRGGRANVLLTSSSKGALIPLGPHRTAEAMEQLAKEQERCSREVSTNTSSVPGSLSGPPSQPEGGTEPTTHQPWHWGFGLPVALWPCQRFGFVHLNLPRHRASLLLQLQQAYAELNRRITEHDKCQRKQMGNTELTLHVSATSLPGCPPRAVQGC